MATGTDDSLDTLRGYAFAVAYRMLGSVTDAEDIVQEAMLRMHQTEEGGEWTKDYSRRLVAIRDDATRMSSLRKEQLYKAVEAGHIKASFVETQAQDTPVGRAGRPEDIAAAVAFLASPDASYITAQTFGVNGGRFP